ncbi:MAG: hypothetical protein AVDCRST_MAG59-3756, partial [uncultured Thermomicrobiales bacterium]
GRRPGRPRLQAARPVAHLLERRRRSLPDPGDHLAGRVRGSLRGDRGGPGGDDGRIGGGHGRSLRAGGRLREHRPAVRRARARVSRV